MHIGLNTQLCCERYNVSLHSFSCIDRELVRHFVFSDLSNYQSNAGIIYELYWRRVVWVWFHLCVLQTWIVLFTTCVCCRPSFYFSFFFCVLLYDIHNKYNDDHVLRRLWSTFVNAALTAAAQNTSKRIRWSENISIRECSAVCHFCRPRLMRWWQLVMCWPWKVELREGGQRASGRVCRLTWNIMGHYEREDTSCYAIEYTGNDNDRTEKCL